MSVLSKAAQALDILERSGRPVRLQELSTELDLPKSSVHRLMSELTQLRLTRKVDGGGFLLGPRLMLYGQAAAEGYDLSAAARTPMRELCDEIGESVHLYVRDGEQRICIHAVDGRFFLRPAAQVGRTVPLGLGAAGRVLFAAAPEPVRERVRARYSAASSPLPTPTEVERIRADMWDVSEGQIEKGLAAGACAVVGPGNSVMAALSVAGAASRLTPEELDRIRPRAQECAAQIARNVSA